MLLGGLWHGANWTFVVWGFLHGLYLCINHFWQALADYLNFTAPASPILKVISCLMTFVLVVIAWVFFRSPDFMTAFNILHSMFSMQLTSNMNSNVVNPSAILLITIALFIVWCLPNTYQLLSRYKPAILTYHVKSLQRSRNWASQLVWKPILAWNVSVAVLMVLGIINIQKSSIFLYFQF